MASNIRRRKTELTDPDNVKEAVLEGLRQIERGEFTELRTEAELREFFADIVRRGKKRLAAKRKAEGAGRSARPSTPMQG